MLQVFLALMLSINFLALQEGKRNDVPRPLEVSVAELTANPERYDQRIVRAKVQWVQLYHGPLACPLDSDKNCIRINLDCHDKESCKPMRDLLTANLKGKPLEDMRAEFVVVGRFVYIKNPASRNGPQFLLEVSKIENVLPKSSRRRCCLTTHSTGAESACLSSLGLNQSAVYSRPVNSGVRRFAPRHRKDNLLLMIVDSPGESA